MTSRSASPATEAPTALHRKSSGFLDAWLSSSQPQNPPSSPITEACPPSCSPGPPLANLVSSSPCRDASTMQPPAKRIKITADNGWKLPQKVKKVEGDENTPTVGSLEVASRVKAEKVAVNRRKSGIGVKRAGAKAKLAALPELPLDILLEIFSHLHPVDLLHLARTTKSLRALLMRKMTIGVWRASVDNVSGLPPCPDDMSHPAYVNLLFDSHCHNCQAKNVKNISFLLRVRYCTRCVKEKLLSIDECSEGTKSNALLKQTVAFAPMGAHGVSHCSIKERDDFLKEIRSLTEGRVEFAERKVAELKIRKSHAKKCHEWLSKQTTARDKELKKTRRERAKAIEQKLIALGYSSEFEFLNEYKEWKTYTFPRPKVVAFKDHPSVKQNKPLTERVWTNIEPIMVEYMDEIKIMRHENDRNAFFETWLAHLSQAYHKWRSHIRTLVKYPAGTDIPIPSLADFLAFPSIRSIYDESDILREWHSLDDSSRGPSSARQQAIIDANLERVKIFLESKMDKEIISWQSQTLQDLYWQFDEKRPSAYTEDKIYCHPYRFWGTTEAEVVERYKKTISLAIMVFRCTNRSVHSEFEDRWADDEGLWLTGHPDYDKYKTALYNTREERALLWFPEVLHHPCQGTKWCRWEETHGDSHPHLKVDPDMPSLRRVPWDSSKLEFDEQASKTVKSLLDAVTEVEPRVKWWEVTAVEMDNRDGRFACLKCSFGERCDGMRAVKVYNWRDAVIHNILAHFGDARTTFELLAAEDAQKAREVQRTMVEALSRPAPLTSSNTQSVANLANATNAGNITNTATATSNPVSANTPAMFANMAASSNAAPVIPPVLQTPDGPRAHITTVYGTDKQRLYLPQDQIKLYRCAACLDKPGIHHNRRMARKALKTHLESNMGCGNHIDFDDVDPVWNWEDEAENSEETKEGGEKHVEYHIGFAPEDDVPGADEPSPKWRPVKGLHYYVALDRGFGRPLPIVKMIPGRRVAPDEGNTSA
ncbi:hypothetical protein BJ165DRAFT_1521588 [Panaeolus papilionaceus]|nr:hypothetical protein BJ165DRAFT_1521588 [Panaeolus papilionaceus]